MDSKKEGYRSSRNQKKLKIVFVIGGPGSGKGTQCKKIAQQFGYTHLSVGELLREEINSGSETGSMIQKIMKEGKLVPSDVTTKMEPEFVLYLDCPQEEMERRLLSRNEGREDDNIETVRKRLKVFMESTLPAVEFYESKGKVKKVDAAGPVDEVFESIKTIFSRGEDDKVSQRCTPRCSIL